MSNLPSLEEPEPGARCEFCGEPIRVVGFCAECDDRLAREKRIESSNDYRRAAQECLDAMMLADRYLSDVEPR